MKFKNHIPIFKMPPSFLNTAEGCYLWDIDRKTCEQVSRAFYLMPGELQQQMEYLPKDGEYEERLKAWKDSLSKKMSPDKYEIAIKEITVLYKELSLEGGN